MSSWRMSPYKQHLLSEMQEEYDQLLESASIAPQIDRAIFRLREEACQFIHHLGLSLRSSSKPEGSLWQTGPELLLPEINPEHKQLCYTRYHLRNRFAEELNSDQQMMTMELQHLIFRLMEVLRTDELMDLVGDTLAYQVIARFAFYQTAGRRHHLPEFWEEEHASAMVFHYRILQALTRVLHSKYENAQATSSILIVDVELAQRFYWTHYLDMDAGFDILTREKFGLKISDGQLTTLVFSNTGVFLGFYSLKETFAKLGDYGQGVWLWQIQPTGILQGTRNPVQGSHQPDLLYDGISWRYLNQELVRTRLFELEPSLASINHKLWQVTLRLSERKQGGIIFIINDPALLTEICQPVELNLDERSRFERLDLSEPTAFSGRRFTPKEYVLEQYRDYTVDLIDTEVLVSFARIDGALVVSDQGKLLGFGVILRPPGDGKRKAEVGARTLAARLASQYGLAIKISEDGPVTVYHQGKKIIES